MENEVYDRRIPTEGQNPLDALLIGLIIVVLFAVSIYATILLGKLILMAFNICATFLLCFIAGSAMLVILYFIGYFIIDLYSPKK